MKAHETLAQRLGRVLETVTRQSGRLPETSDYGSWLLGKSTEGPASAPGANPGHPHDVHRGDQHDRYRGGDPAGDRGGSRAQRVRGRAALADVLGAAELHRRRADHRNLVDHPPDHQRAALGGRRAPAQPGRPAQHLSIRRGGLRWPTSCCGVSPRCWPPCSTAVVDTAFIPRFLGGAGHRRRNGRHVHLSGDRVHPATGGRAGAGRRTRRRTGSRPGSWAAS